MSSFNHRRWLKNLLILFGAVSLLVLAAVILLRRAYYDNLKPVSTVESSVVVTVPQGASLREIANILDDTGLIRSDWAFEWYVNSQDVRDRLLAGTYALRPNQSVQEIVEAITQGRVNTDLVTVLPGKRIDQIRASLINDGFNPSDVDQALNPKTYSGHPVLVDKPPDINLEGYIYPESFQKTAQTNPQDIIRASLDQMQRYLTPKVRAGLVRQGLTVHQGVILASIIEREVGNPDDAKDLADKKRVAQIFLRRLKEDIALESDATARYGAILDGQEPSLTYDSLYNTYQNKGLPPGPISNVGKNALLAAAEPAQTDFLFFVSGDRDENGVSVTHFSRTLDEHEANVRKYCSTACGQ